MTTQTQTAERTETDPRQEPLQEAKSKGDVVVLAPPRIAFPPVAAKRYNVGLGEWRVLCDSIFPSARTVEGVLLALAYCDARKLDIMKRPVNVVSVWNSALGREIESVWPGIGETRTTAHRTGLYAGCDPTVFGEDVTTTFKGRVKVKKDWEDVEVTVTHPSWAQITVYRIVAGVRCAFPGPRIMYLSAYGRRSGAPVPNEKWTNSPHYMSEKVAEAAALRKAFPEECSDPTAEEMEDQIVDHAPGNVVQEPTPLKAETVPPKPTRESVEQARKEDVGRKQEFRQTTAPAATETVVHDAETGEILDQSEPGATEPDDTDADAASGTAADTAPGIDFIAVRKRIEARLVKAGTMAQIDEIASDYAKELAAMRAEEPEMAKALGAAFAAKRKGK